MTYDDPRFGGIIQNLSMAKAADAAIGSANAARSVLQRKTFMKNVTVKDFNIEVITGATCTGTSQVLTQIYQLGIGKSLGGTGDVSILGTALVGTAGQADGSVLDGALTENQSELVHLLRTHTVKNIEVLMTIVVQDKDLQKISKLLEPYGCPSTHIASTGGFLGRRNATVLIGLPKGKRLEIRKLLESANVSNLKIDSGESKISPELAHEGATIFSLDIERYEEL